MSGGLRRIVNADSWAYGLYRRERAQPEAKARLKKVNARTDAHAAANTPTYEDATGRFRCWRRRPRTMAGRAEWHVATRSGNNWRVVRRETSRAACERWIGSKTTGENSDGNRS